MLVVVSIGLIGQIVRDLFLVDTFLSMGVGLLVTGYLLKESWVILEVGMGIFSGCFRCGTCFYINTNICIMIVGLETYKF